ncbi:MAG: class D beta-lactamase [Spirochaetes bacterium]|nr:MAG: class D beta-lactamase [Spirochaetota bacterium]
MKIVYACVLCLSLLTACARGGFMEKYFQERGLNATIVVQSLGTGREYTYNEERARTGFLPASTFKIPNMLISLEEGALRDGNEVLRWDGTDRGRPEWNRDHTVMSAFRSSCVWCYRELVRRVGREKFTRYLALLDYGNGDAGGAADGFWLDGALRISARGQVEFMKGVIAQKFPFDKKNYAILKEAMFVEKAGECRIYAKTGLATDARPPVGWYVGYAETPDDTWLFACNLEIKTGDDASYRKESVYEALRTLGAIRR